MSGGLRHTLEVQASFIRNSFLKMLAYRLRYYTGILTYLLFVSVHYFIWKAVFAGREQELVNGFTFTEMVTYVSIGWITRSFYFSNTDEEIDDLVRTGQVSVYLLRPVGFQSMMLAQAVGDSLFRLVFFAPPIALVVLTCFEVLPPASIGDALLFAIATGIGFLIMAQINFLVGMLAFRFKSIEGVMRAKYYLVQLLSGLLLPIAFFPGWLQGVVEALPFKLITFVPLQFYLGKLSGTAQVTSMLAEQLLWAVLLAMAGALAWRKTLARVTIQGG
jgi:ABC-2 type transport system permease protein